eukprot:scaffold34_cov104-Alexandrium_tamarense.AAC.1
MYCIINCKTYTRHLLQEGTGKGRVMGLNGVMPFQRDECLTSLNNQHNNQHPEFAQCFSTIGLCLNDAGIH